MGSIPAIPDALCAPSLLFHERFNEAYLPRNCVVQTTSAQHLKASNPPLRPNPEPGTDGFEAGSYTEPGGGLAPCREMGARNWPTAPQESRGDDDEQIGWGSEVAHKWFRDGIMYSNGATGQKGTGFCNGAKTRLSGPVRKTAPWQKTCM